LNCDINILKKYNENNKLTVFVGAGVSKSSNLPSWGDLIDMIKSELFIDNSETDYLKIAQLYYLSCGETVYYQKIKKFFPENIEPTEIQKLIFNLKPANIITTNWDILLEKTAQNNGFIYDVISKDEHLVQSELENHIIKMHGDFRDNNIVFKEDDYINYKNNFPLIENYVKSILSTNAILFLGYSYGDINLKQITKWIQNNSKVMPPMFLVVFKENKNQSKYLENFGIQTIVIQTENVTFGLDSNSNKLATFLTYLNSEENYIDIQKSSDYEIIDFVYNKLKPLDNLNAILLEQIQSTLSNCGFIYEPTKNGNLILLEFYKDALTYDINNNIRGIHTRFREIIQKEDLSKDIIRNIEKIFLILNKANIDGIILSDDFTSPKNYLPYNNSNISNSFKSLCNFKFDVIESNENDIKLLMETVFIFYQKYEFLKAYKLNEKTIKLCLKQQNYIQLFLAMFNQNILLNILKSRLDNIGADREYKTASEAWQYNIKPYNLDERFYELPKPIQKVLYEIKPFMNYDYLYKLASVTDDQLDKKIKQKKAIENNGGMTWDTNITRNYSKQKNLVYFVLNNFIMMERNFEFISINKKMIKISLIRQMQQEHFILDKMELFTVIKYITHKDLIELLNEFENKIFKIDIKNLNWLTIKVFPNIVKLFNQHNTIYGQFNDELKNILHLLSLVKLNNKQTQTTVKQIKILINGPKTNLDIYEQVNKFIDCQENINQKDLIDTLEMMIHKIICYEANIWDYQAVENNSFWSPFKHLNNQKIIYENIALIEKFLKELEGYSQKQKIQLSKGFLINLYKISNDKIKSLIKSFILNIDIEAVIESKLDDIDVNDTQKFDFNGLGNYGLKISFKLFLAINNLIEIDNKLIDEVKQYPEQDKDNLYFLREVTGQVRYLVEELKIQDLEELLSHLLKVIDEVNQKQKDITRMII